MSMAKPAGDCGLSPVGIRCWLSISGGSIAAFLAPVAVLSLVSAGAVASCNGIETHCNVWCVLGQLWHSFHIAEVQFHGSLTASTYS